MIEPLRIQPADFRAPENDAEETIRGLLGALGEDPSREGLVDTPRRVWESLQFLTSGYAATAAEAVGDALFHEEYDGIVLIRDISLFSLCEHHLLPFTGTVHIAYVPDGQIVGLSKVPRLVNVFARRLQVQERLTHQISQAIDEVVHPRGSVVRVEATHLCMAMRGVQETQSVTVTEAVTGVFAEDASLQAQFREMLAGPETVTRG